MPITALTDAVIHCPAAAVAPVPPLLIKPVLLGERGRLEWSSRVAVLGWWALLHVWREVRLAVIWRGLEAARVAVAKMADVIVLAWGNTWADERPSCRYPVLGIDVCVLIWYRQLALNITYVKCDVVI